MKKLTEKKEQMLIIESLYKLMNTLEKSGVNMEYAEYLIFSIVGRAVNEQYCPHRLDQYVNDIKKPCKNRTIKKKRKKN